MRIAILGATHWHVDLYYVPALQKAGAEIIAVHDPDAEALQRVCPGLECPRYTDHQALLEAEAPDLVFAHAPHADMTALADDLIERGQPFHMEKPMGTHWPKVDALAVKAATNGVWTSVALVSRYYGLVEALREALNAGELGKPVHYYHSLFAGSPLRYKDWGVGWMLDPEIAGGGPLWNFGPHVVDLFLYLVDSQVTEVSCWTSHGIYGLEIEDIATIRLTGASGAIGLGEVSYTMPSSYERFFSLTTDRLHCGGTKMGQGAILFRDGSESVFEGPDSDTVYEAYVADTLRCFEAGAPARATVSDMARVLKVLDAARTSAKIGEPVTVRP